MTREEFDAHRDDPCRSCGSPVALETDPHNQNRVQVICSSAACLKARQPWGLIVFLKMSVKKRRKPYAPADGLYEVWEHGGNVCWCCGAPLSFLVLLGIAIERHHPLEYAKTEHDGPKVPVCQPCHEVITLRQREVRRWQQRLRELYGESLSDGGARVSGDGVSSDSLYAEGEAPAGAVEGISAGHADH